MHRTQIYLQEDLYQQLRDRSQAQGASISELIRRAVERDLSRSSASDAQAFFDRLQPLESFRDQQPEAYVDGLRGKSRLLRPDAADDD